MIQCVTPTENAILDLVYSMASASDILVMSNPRDAAALSSEGSVVRKIVARDDQCNIESEIVKTLAARPADLLTKLMPVSQPLLDRLPELGVNRVVIGKKISQNLKVPPGLALLDGALDDETEVLNRPWLKRCKTGLPLITGLQLLGLDGVPVNGQKSISWGLEKFGLQSMFISSGCIVNPERLPDINGLLDCEIDDLKELQIFGRTIRLMRLADTRAAEHGFQLRESISSHSGCHITWCLGKGTLETLFKIGMIDEVVTQIVPALNGLVIDRDCSSTATADSVGNFARIKSVIKNTGRSDS